MKVAIMGAAGRMGRTLARVVEDTPDCTLVGGIEPQGSPHIGADIGVLAGIGETGFAIVDDPLELITDVEAILDFTLPGPSAELATLTAQARIVHVIGTTGFDDDQKKHLAAAARHARIVQSGNMSLGVNLLAALVKKVASALDETFDIEVLEMHHRTKVDAPSGTALLLGDAAAEGRRVSLTERAVRSRDGHTGARLDGDIGFATLRGGSVVGEHSVLFAGPSERLVLGHVAESRDIFARGAVRAAQWALDKEPGLYSMADVLGIADL